MLEAKAKMEAIEDKLDQLGETLKGQAGSIEMCDLHRQLAASCLHIFGSLLAYP